MHYNYTFKARSHQLLAVRMTNTGASTVDEDTEQLFRTSWSCTMHCVYSYGCAKGFQFWTL